MLYKTLPAKWQALDLDSDQGRHTLSPLSIHQHVVNFQVDGGPHLLFVADQDLSKGPATIGLTNESFRLFSRQVEQIAAGWYDHHQLFIETESVKLVIDRCTGEKISFAPVFFNALNDNASLTVLNCYEKLLKSNDIPTPAAVLLNCNGGEDYYRQAIAQSFSSIINALIYQKRQELIKYCRNICGMGHGLTPSGDDLIHGALIAFSACGKPGKDFFRLVQLEMKELSALTGLFGWHMIDTGCRGLTAEPLIRYLEAINSGVYEPAILAEVLKIGSRTGYDLAIAVTATLSALLKKKIFR